jgi:hypothetical protein
MNIDLNINEFQKFRWAHSRVNSLLYLSTAPILSQLIGTLGWVIWGVIFVVACLSTPRLGYFLAKHIVGEWYKLDFGSSYMEYRKNEKRVVAALLLNNEN